MMPSSERRSENNRSYTTYKSYIETRSPEVVANIIICVIHQANYLLDQQKRQLERDFLAEGGLRERMTRARLAARHGPRNNTSHTTYKPPIAKAVDPGLNFVDSSDLFCSCSAHACAFALPSENTRSEEHTSELQSRPHLVCR